MLNIMSSPIVSNTPATMVKIRFDIIGVPTLLCSIPYLVTLVPSHVLRVVLNIGDGGIGWH